MTKEYIISDVSGDPVGIVTSSSGPPTNQRPRSWRFVKSHRVEMGKLCRQSGLIRVCTGLVGLTTSELKCDAEQEVPRAKIENQTLQQFLGGKVLEQHLEHPRVFGEFRKRNARAVHDYLDCIL